MSDECVDIVIRKDVHKKVYSRRCERMLIWYEKLLLWYEKVC